MRFREIKGLVKALSDYDASDKIEFDNRLIEEMSARFSRQSDEHLLTEDDLSYIKAVFQKRWLKVFDTGLDYTAKVDGINQLWILLAHKIEEQSNDISYLQILFPNLRIDTDPNNFKKISDKQDCLELFVAGDQSLHLILSLIEHIDRQKFQLSTYRNNNGLSNASAIASDKSRTYPLSILELSRFKRSAGKSFKFYENNYDNFWAFLSERVFPALQKYGDLPTHLFPLFLGVVKGYFENKLQPAPFDNFKLELKSWMDCLLECSVHDVNQFYGVRLPYRGEDVYLFELLIEVHEARDYVIDEPLITLAQWILKENPSFAMRDKAFDSIYQELGMASYFSLQDFKQNIQKCLQQRPHSNSLAKKLVLLLSLTENATEISSEMIEQLKEIYRLRWDAIIDTELDYTRLQSKDNQIWIGLAQQLVAAGFIESNYYRFLMPTLRHQNETATGEPLTYYPLSHYILSDNNEQLILLDDCVSQHKANGTFYSWKDNVAQPLSIKEISRMQYAASTFLSLYQRISSNVVIPSISLNTIHLLKQLLAKILHAKGLYSGRYYSDREMAQTAEELVKFDQALDQNEREKLHQQIIIHEGKKKTFAEVWQGIENDECITLLGKYLLQLLMNYAPYMTFSSEFEAEFNIKDMREQGTGLVFSDYESLNKDQVEQACQLIFISIMTYSFQMFPLCGKDLEFWDCKNTVNEEARKIFLLLSPMFQSGDFSKARLVYAQIMEGIIKQGMEKHSLLNRLKTLDKTNRWLISLRDGTILGYSYKVYEVEHLLQFALRLHYKNSIPCDKLIDELLRTELQETSHLNRKMRANILFLQYLNSLPNELMQDLLQQITAQDWTCQKEAVYRQCRKYLLQKCHLVQRISSPRASFFAAEGKQELDKFNQNNPDEDEFNSIHSVIDDLQESLRMRPQPLALQTATQTYLSRLMTPVHADKLMEHLNTP